MDQRRYPVAALVESAKLVLLGLKYKIEVAKSKYLNYLKGA